MRESTIEKQVCNYAQEKGWLTFKFSSPNMRGVPDRMFIKHGVMFFVEFKAPNKKPTALQSLRMMALSDHGFDSYVINSVPAGKRLIDALT